MLHARLLTYLDEVARCGSIRKAGETLNVASSAINRQILALEIKLGTPIFQRLPRRMVLTAAGEVLIAHVRETLRAMTRAQAQIEDMRGLKRGEVSIAAVSGLAGTLIPMAITHFRESRPRVKFKISVLPNAEIVERVAEGVVDLGLGFNLSIDRKVRILGSVPSGLGAVVGVDHPLARRRHVRLSDCAGFPICTADSTMAIRVLLERAASRISLSLDPIVETNSVEVMRRMAKVENCITFLSRLETNLVAVADNLVYLPVKEDAFDDDRLMLVGSKHSGDVHLSGLIETIKSIMIANSAQ